jgi:tetratricopeptide (TPR) repeat protein
VLLLGLGNAPPRFHFASIHCENYLERNTEGHEIITFGYNEGVDIRINTEDGFEKVVENLPHGWIPHCCILWEVDWNLLPRGIENAPFPTIAIPWDWDYDVPLSKNCAELTDLLIAFGDFEQEALQTMTGSKVEKFYSVGIMEKYFSPHPKKIKDRKYDILYTTGISDTEKLDRSQWILKLCELSDKYHVNIDEHSPNFDGYIDLLRDSKLVLSHHRFGSMSGRILDAGAQGTVTLETGSEVEKHFVPDKEYIPVNDENIFEQIDKYLGNQELLQEMSDRVYSKVIREYEARKRFVRFLEFLDKTLKSRKSFKKVNTFTEYERYIRRGEIYFYSFFRATSYFIVNSGNKLIETSIEEFKKAVDIEPTPRAMTNLAIAHVTYDLLDNRKEFLKDRIPVDIDLFKKVIASYPSYVMAYYNLGLFQMRINDYKEARNTFSVIVKLFEDGKSQLDPWCLHNRDFDLFNNLLRKSLNHNLLLFCKGEKDKAMNKMRDLYHAATLFFISLIDENEGAINKVLESLLEAHSLYPESGLIAMNVAKRLYLLGYRKESLNMYEKAISLLPLQIDLRIEYMKILHSYHMNTDAMNELENALKITSRITMLKEKTAILEALREEYASSGYSYNLGNERFLNDVAKLLYTFLKKDPQNLTLISRIIDVWYELGRVDKMFEVVEYFISNYSDKTRINYTSHDRLAEICKKLQQACYIREKTLKEKCNNLEIIINTLKA